MFVRSKKFAAFAAISEFLVWFVWIFSLGAFSTHAQTQAQVVVPRVAMVRPASALPHEADPAVIFQDDFRQAPVVPRYFEYDASNGSFVWTAEAGLGLGPEPGVMRCQFEKGQVSAGSLKILFGRNPFNRGVRKTESFREISLASLHPA
jgi:hypothetical protein